VLASDYSGFGFNELLSEHLVLNRDVVG